jgi:hypothetical protein
MDAILESAAQSRAVDVRYNDPSFARS